MSLSGYKIEKTCWQVLMRGNNMTCDDKNCNCNEEEDDFEIQRLQDIIAICEFLIKHKRNQKHRDTLDDILDHLKDDTNDTKNNSQTTRIIYQPVYPNWYWNKRNGPWYNIWS